MRRTFSKILFISLSLFSAASFGQAPATADRKMSDTAAGYSFTAPGGWKSSQNAEGFAFVNPAETIILSVRQHGYRDFASLARDTTFEPGFEVSGQPQDLKGGGKALRVTKKNPNGVGVIDFFVTFSPNGGGVIVMALSDSRNAEAAFYAGLKISDSVTFSKPQQQAAAGGSSAWQSTLAGKHLLYLYSGNGYFEEKHIYLCKAGTFFQTTGSGGFNPTDANDGSFAARGGKRGQWAVWGNTLQLRFQDGSVGNYSITPRPAGNEIGLNGRRYFVQANVGC